jgi:membrane fusion protein, multidrug efflux system
MDATVTAPAQVMQRRRTRWLLIAVTAFVIVGVGSTVYWWLFARNYEETDDAYVAGDLVNVSSQVSGTVVSIDADETDLV